MRTTLFFILTACGSGAVGGDDVVTTEPMVVTATRSRMALEDTLQHTSVIGSEDFAGTPDLLPRLRTEPGFENAQSGGIGKQSSTFMRGTESDHTLVLIDGIRINPANFGGAALEHVLPAQVERVEIVRGNGSSLYGSDAIGGVIQVFTPRGSELPRLRLNAGVGSHASGQLGLAYGGATDATRYHLGVSGYDSEGYSDVRADFVPLPGITAPQDSDRDGYRNVSATASLAHQYAPASEIGATAFVTRGEVEFDGAAENRSAPELSVYSAFVSRLMHERWHSKLTLGQAVDDARYFLDQTSTSRFRTVNRQLTWQNEFALGTQRTLIAGLEWLRQSGAVDTAFGAFDASRRVRSAYLGYTGEEGPHLLQASLRHDRYSDAGDETTGRAGYGYRFSPHWRAHLALSNAFKAPSFSDLYFPNSGNRNLKPEQARGLEAGVQFAAGAHLLRVLGSHMRIDELIGLDASFRAINIDRARIDALELSYAWTLGARSVRASLTLQNPRDRTTGHSLLRRAKRFGSLSVTQQLGALRLSGELVASGPRADFNFDFFTGGEVRLAAYAVLNLVGDYHVGTQTRLGLRLDNLFDKRYELIHGYNAQPRRFMLNLQHELR